MKTLSTLRVTSAKGCECSRTLRDRHVRHPVKENNLRNDTAQQRLGWLALTHPRATDWPSPVFVPGSHRRGLAANG